MDMLSVQPIKLSTSSPTKRKGKSPAKNTPGPKRLAVSAQRTAAKPPAIGAPIAKKANSPNTSGANTGMVKIQNLTSGGSNTAVAGPPANV